MFSAEKSEGHQAGFWNGVAGPGFLLMEGDIHTYLAAYVYVSAAGRGGVGGS